MHHATSKLASWNGKRSTSPNSTFALPAKRAQAASTMCEAVRPHLRRALEADAAERGVAAPDADELAAIMVYGCIGLASGPGMPDERALAAARRYLRALLTAFRSDESLN